MSMQERKNRKENPPTGKRSHAGVSNKCGCRASIDVKMPEAYARQLGIYNPDAHPRNAAKKACHSQPTTSSSDGGDGDGHSGADDDGTPHQPQSASPPAEESDAQSAQHSNEVTVIIRHKHEGHEPNSQADLLAQRVHRTVVAKIEELAAESLNTQQLYDAICRFSKEYTKENGLHADPTYHAGFFPSPQVVANIRARALRRRRLHAVDQEAIQRHATQLQQNGKWNVFFRPYKEDSSKFTLVLQSHEQARTCTAKTSSASMPRTRPACGGYPCSCCAWRTTMAMAIQLP